MAPPAKGLKLQANTKRIVTIGRSSPEASEAQGVVRSVGGAWALVQILDDLRLDGWECLRTGDIERVARGTRERFAERVLLGEGAPLTPLPEVALGDTSTLLKSLRVRPMVVLECEGDGGFLIGKLLRVDARSAVLHQVDADGAWQPDATRVQLDEVTRVQFGNHYCDVFERYAAARAAPGATLERLAGL